MPQRFELIAARQRRRHARPGKDHWKSSRPDDLFPADAGHDLDDNELARFNIELENTKIGEHKRSTGSIASMLPLLRSQKPTSRTGDIDLPDKGQRRMTGDIKRIITMHIGNIGHASLAWKADKPTRL